MLRTQHPDDEPIVLLAYGPDHSDLAPFLRSLIKAGTSRVHRFPSTQASRRHPPSLLRPDLEIETLVTAVCADSPRPVPVLGPAVSERPRSLWPLSRPPRVRTVRRAAVVRPLRGEQLTSRDALIGEIATALALSREANSRSASSASSSAVPVCCPRQCRDALGGGPGEGRRAPRHLGGLTSIALVASVRGDERPLVSPGRGDPGWPARSSRRTRCVLAVAGDHFRNDPVLDRLLEAVDGFRLAVTLLPVSSGGPGLSASGAGGRRKGLLSSVGWERHAVS